MIKSDLQWGQEKHCFFEGNVEFFLDRTLHGWADQIVYDQSGQTLMLQTKAKTPLVLEDQHFLILADRILCDIKNKGVTAYDIRLHCDEGFIKARKALRSREDGWVVWDLSYTACDHDQPHWQFKADRASLSYAFIKARNVSFQIQDFSFFKIPCLVVPLQGTSHSGFLVPHFSFDYKYGLGFQQEYYWLIAPRMDMKIGVDWKDRRGIIFSDEFRWGRSKNNITFFNAHYGSTYGTFVPRGEKIVQEKKKCYWINAHDFRTYGELLEKTRAYSLVRLDFGTDKRVNYQFFDKPEDVEDSFYNACIMRGMSEDQLVHLEASYVRTNRKNFKVFSHDAPLIDRSEKKVPERYNGGEQRDDNARLMRLPHLERNKIFSFWGKNVLYRDDIFWDYVITHNDQQRKVYKDRYLIEEEAVIPGHGYDTFRFEYAGLLKNVVTGRFGSINVDVKPHIQLRSRTLPLRRADRIFSEQYFFAQAAGRLFFQSCMEWYFPEYTSMNESSSTFCMIQPSLSWKFLPKFFQSHWFYMDRWDRWYPTNQVALAIRADWMYQDLTYELTCAQSCNFYKQDNLFPLARLRGSGESVFDPLFLQARVNASNKCSIALNSYVDPFKPKIWDCRMQMDFRIKHVDCNVTYLFQQPTLQQKQEKVSSIPHHMAAHFSMPIHNSVRLHYGGYFWGTADRLFRPLLHQFRIEYNGHCWGFYLGAEEKVYREFGNIKREHLIVFSCYFDSLGSFAKKFKAPYFSSAL